MYMAEQQLSCEVRDGIVMDSQTVKNKVLCFDDTKIELFSLVSHLERPESGFPLRAPIQPERVWGDLQRRLAENP